MEEKKLVPKRRFRGFDGEWKSTLLKECVEYVKGFAFKSKDYRKNGIRLVRVSDLDYKDINYNNDSIFIGPEYEESYKEYRLYKDDIIITTVGSQAELKESAVGRPIIVKHENEGLLNQNLVKLTAKKQFDPYFIYGNLLKAEYAIFISAIERGNANQANITLEELWAYKVRHGVPEEQQKIGKFFKVLDERIANQERKIAKVKALKEAYLTEMFPQEGEAVPKRRFDGFEGKWGERNLGDIAIINTGNSDVKDAVADGEYPFFIRSKNIERSNIYTFDGEAILIPGEGKLGEVYHYYNGKFNYHQRVYKISDFHSYVNGRFVYYAMHLTFKDHALKETVKATVDSLRLPTLISYKLLLPSFSEQQKIGQFFKNLDDQIQAEEAKLEKLKKTKEAYLEEMFV